MQCRAIAIHPHADPRNHSTRLAGGCFIFGWGALVPYHRVPGGGRPVGFAPLAAAASARRLVLELCSFVHKFLYWVR
eukprot:scaffold4673_cov61-Attheya_sp.AAC.2